MYEKEEMKIKQDLYDILTHYQDKLVITEKVWSYIQSNINLMFDIMKNNKE
jgi:hypothetical protein